MIQLIDVCKAYDNKNNVLNKLKIALPKTGLICFCGKSGVGKSTLLNLLAFLDSPTSGEIIYDGKKINYQNHEELNIYNQYKSFVFQEYYLIDDWTVRKNLELCIFNKSKAETDHLISGVLREVNLSGFQDSFVKELSGGEKQRCALSRALLLDTPIFVADEPSGNIDEKNARNIFSILKSISKNKLVLVSTHNMEFARFYADRIIKLEDGEVASDIILNEINIRNEIEEKPIQLPKRKSSKFINKLLFENLFKNKTFVVGLLLVIISIISMTIFSLFSISPYKDYTDQLFKDEILYYDLGTVDGANLSYLYFDKLPSAIKEISLPYVDIFFDFDMNNDETEYPGFIETAFITNNQEFEYLSDKSLVIGENHTLGNHEAFVTDYIVDALVAHGYLDAENEYSDMIGKTIILYGEEFTIRNIVLTGYEILDSSDSLLQRNFYLNSIFLNQDDIIPLIHSGGINFSTKIGEEIYGQVSYQTSEEHLPEENLGEREIFLSLDIYFSLIEELEIDYNSLEFGVTAIDIFQNSSNSFLSNTRTYVIAGIIDDSSVLKTILVSDAEYQDLLAFDTFGKVVIDETEITNKSLTSFVEASVVPISSSINSFMVLNVILEYSGICLLVSGLVLILLTFSLIVYYLNQKKAKDSYLLGVMLSCNYEYTSVKKFYMLEVIIMVLLTNIASSGLYLLLSNFISNFLSRQLDLHVSLHPGLSILIISGLTTLFSLLSAITVLNKMIRSNVIALIRQND